jgi:hypothetical protein
VGIHQERTHPTYVEGCRPCKWSTVDLFQVGVSDAAARRILKRARNEFEVESYRKLRAQGIQPNGSQIYDLVEARNKSRLRDEPYDAAIDDGSRDWGTRESTWTERDGIGDVDVPPMEVKL